MRVRIRISRRTRRRLQSIASTSLLEPAGHCLASLFRGPQRVEQLGFLLQRRTPALRTARSVARPDSHQREILQQANSIFIKVGPPAGLRLVFFEIVTERTCVRLKKRHREIARKNIVESGDISRTCIDACPLSARIPPPGRPMFPSNSCRIAAARMICTPSECCVQPTA